jgi:hypothetical protein
MHATPPPDSPLGRNIETLLEPRSLAPRVLEALRALGYSLSEGAEPDLPSSGIWLVDEARLPEVPDSEFASDARILLISSPRQKPLTDPRILAQTARPARLSGVYAMIQKALERNPRRNPRVRTKLSARFLRAERQSIGALLSLSEGGCLLRTGEPLKKGTRLGLQFALPEYGLVSTSAECRYVRSGDAGLEFNDPPTDIRQSIAHFVTQRLAENLIACPA